MRRKFLSLFTLIISTFSIALSVNIGNKTVSAQETTPELSYTDINENFDALDNNSYNQDVGSKEIGDWKIYFVNEKGNAEILDDPTNSNMGKVLRLDNAPTGTYLHLAYNKLGYNARNFTISFDAYMEDGSDTSWIGTYARLSNPGKNMESIKADFLMTQKGKGVSTDQIITSSGETRPANGDDEYYQFQPKYSFAMGGLGTMRDEYTDKSKDYGRFYNIDGGSLSKVWLSFKYEVRGNYFYSYAKNKNQEDWQFLGFSYLSDEDKKIFSGNVAIGTCGGNYLVDNIKVINEDKYNINVKSLASEKAGKAYTYQETAGENTDVNLIMELNEGYVYDKWYKSEDLKPENIVVPKEIKIQEFKLNERFLVYEWKDYNEYDLELKSFEDLENPVPFLDDGTKINEYFTGKNYRLVVTLSRNDNGNDYFGSIKKREYDNELNISDTLDGKVTLNGEEISFPDTKRYPIDTELTLVATPNEGKVFDGWYEIIVEDDNEYKIRLSKDTAFVYNTKLGGTNIKAVFVDEGTEQFNVTIDKVMRLDETADGEFGEIITKNGEYYSGEEISLIAQEKNGYSFYYWEIDGERVDGSNKYNIVVDKDINVKAVFEIEKYRVNIDNGFGENYVRIVAANSMVRLVAPVAPNGYVFSRWIITGITSSTDLDVERSAVFIASNKNIYAKAVYIPEVFSVKASVEDSKYGVIKGKGQYQVGDVVKITVKPKDGYTVAKYVVRGTELILDENGNCSFVMPSNDVIIRVQFSVIDKIETNKEIITYAVFGAFIVSITGCLLFLKKKKDKD